MSDARSLHQQILEVTAHYRSIKHELAVLLARMADGPFAELGYSSVAAYAYNELDLTGRQVRALLRVVTPETEAEWVERAKQVNSRQLENQIGVSLMGEGPPDDEPKGPQPRRVSYTMGAQEADLLGAAIAMVRQATGLNADELDDHVDATHVGLSACDSEVQDGRPGPTRGHLARTIPPATRRAVLHRDRWRCAVPGCHNELWLDLHHVRERHLGGDHSEGNLLTLCGSHHRTVHAGLMAVERGATGGVRVEFGDGRVLRRPHLGGVANTGPKPIGRQDQPGGSGP